MLSWFSFHGLLDHVLGNRAIWLQTRNAILTFFFLKENCSCLGFKFTFRKIYILKYTQQNHFKNPKQCKAIMSKQYTHVTYSVKYTIFLVYNFATIAFAVREISLTTPFIIEYSACPSLTGFLPMLKDGDIATGSFTASDSHPSLEVMRISISTTRLSCENRMNTSCNNLYLHSVYKMGGKTSMINQDTVGNRLCNLFIHKW